MSRPATPAARFFADLRAKIEYGAGGQCTFLAATPGKRFDLSRVHRNYRGPGVTVDRNVSITVEQQENRSGRGRSTRRIALPRVCHRDLAAQVGSTRSNANRRERHDSITQAHAHNKRVGARTHSRTLEASMGRRTDPGWREDDMHDR